MRLWRRTREPELLGTAQLVGRVLVQHLDEEDADPGGVVVREELDNQRVLERIVDRHRRCGRGDRVGLPGRTVREPVQEPVGELPALWIAQPQLPDLGRGTGFDGNDLVSRPPPGVFVVQQDVRRVDHPRVQFPGYDLYLQEPEVLVRVHQQGPVQCGGRRKVVVEPLAVPPRQRVEVVLDGVPVVQVELLIEEE